MYAFLEIFFLSSMAGVDHLSPFVLENMKRRGVFFKP
jgi:hypothetical protein